MAGSQPKVDENRYRTKSTRTVRKGKKNQNKKKKKKKKKTENHNKDARKKLVLILSPSSINPITYPSNSSHRPTSSVLHVTHHLTISTYTSFLSMGACLSCLLPPNDGDAHERTSLLGNNTQYSDEDLQKELAKQQQRQSELNTIVNDLNDNLIDVSTFLTNGSAGPNFSIPADYSHASITEDDTTSPKVAPAGSEGGKSYPHVMGLEEKEQIMQRAQNIDSCRVVCDGPLYVTF
ncbi:hypothetical protein CLUG_04370 [Clavispora lusitaniae ATCC 42720]|uniref:Uncharacterized protein n=2 Tax=Clavispora lusitaniae TaxID=36911 RepID=C4Y842_CLAL4|nr:uncharacterized protein CLUG_04370 [Clavispora lusitaniae ATCC 42720]EEQ40242.1 hypothetical protein CLUG_04370 [Clavispora lusitaniae ATCC 42720]